MAQSTGSTRRSRNNRAARKQRQRLMNSSVDGWNKIEEIELSSDNDPACSSASSVSDSPSTSGKPAHRVSASAGVTTAENWEESTSSTTRNNTKAASSHQHLRKNKKAIDRNADLGPLHGGRYAAAGLLGLCAVAVFLSVYTILDAVLFATPASVDGKFESHFFRTPRAAGEETVNGSGGTANRSLLAKKPSDVAERFATSWANFWQRGQQQRTKAAAGAETAPQPANKPVAFLQRRDVDAEVVKGAVFEEIVEAKAVEAAKAGKAFLGRRSASASSAAAAPAATDKKKNKPATVGQLSARESSSQSLLARGSAFAWSFLSTGAGMLLPAAGTGRGTLPKAARTPLLAVRPGLGAASSSPSSALLSQSKEKATAIGVQVMYSEGRAEECDEDCAPSATRQSKASLQH
mmetsp:Transcript_16966/g.42052  ORF Transcript_16966/g.42052 Transcript_16966/m.42052 type:complete len:407 (-) Transcript_16966:753-1973(-)|eukprot:CAMPEP_0178993414 /NCGR_PEP_ID=MMETSP0795-20121207/6690_1 /TAXON_ID=88552 /ORGANISM="Amoebophrya sp., Strain Ameob2" /LENGTH=406 /DNA_ID=CAMNT_0020685471 /DNA_START=170 /DNA_END=1390 /DNA_ORIENTATION=-